MIIDNTRNNELLIETEDHIRSLERSLDSLNDKIAESGLTRRIGLAGSRDRLERIIAGNREERDLLIREIERIAHANVTAE